MYRSIQARGDGLIGSANDDQVFTIHVDKGTRCVSLQMKTEGGGFAYFKFNWYYDGDGEEFYRLYPRHFDTGQWKVVKLPVQGPVYDVSV